MVGLSMRLGLDFHETITSHPGHFRKLAQATLEAGGEVYIITAVKPWNKAAVVEEIKQLGIKYTAIDVVTFEDYDKVPELKLLKAKQRKLDFMVDDRQDTCQLMTKRGITGLCVTQRGNNEDKLHRQPSGGGLAPQRHSAGGQRGIGRPLGTGIIEPEL